MDGTQNGLSVAPDRPGYPWTNRNHSWWRRQHNGRVIKHQRWFCIFIFRVSTFISRSTTEAKLFGISLLVRSRCMDTGRGQAKVSAGTETDRCGTDEGLVILEPGSIGQCLLSGQNHLQVPTVKFEVLTLNFS